MRDLYASAAAAIALSLPPAIRAVCDRLLGGTENPHERWPEEGSSRRSRVGTGGPDPPASTRP